MTNLSTATTILDHLGGGQFLSMTGASHLVGSNGSLQFALPGRFAKNRINRVHIALDANDTYTISFARIWGLRAAVIDEVSGVYAADLCEVFTGYTGLECSLGVMA